MKISISIGVFMLLSVGGVNAQSSRPARSDTQNWNDVYLSVPLARQVDFLMQGTLRNGRHLTRPVDERLGIGFSFKLGKYLTVIPNYLYIGTQPFEDRRVFENRLSVITTVRIPVGHFVLADRNIFERRFRRPGIDSTRYRNRLQVEHPIGPAKQRISLFASDEVFYDWSFNALVRNRPSVGVSKAVNKHFTLELYYLRQNDSYSEPGDLHVIGTAWRFKL
jgi:hypothetical protein